MILSIAIFCCVCGLVPILLGSLYVGGKKQTANSSIINSYAQGMFMMWGVFQIIVIPLLLMRKSLTLLTVIWSIVIIALCVLAVIRGRNKVILNFNFKDSLKNNISWPIIVAILLIILQTFMLTTRMHQDADDAFYVAAASTAVETDSILAYSAYTGGVLNNLPTRYALSPFYAFTAMISKICGINPTIIAHTLFPLILIPLAYIVYTLLGRYFFKNKAKTVGIFLITISLLQIFSAFSVYTTGVFTLSRIWQGKATLAGILIPAIFYFSFMAFEQADNKRNWISLLMVMFASCMVSSMGIPLSAITLGLLALTASIRDKNPKIIGYSLLCCLPNMLYAGIYLLMRADII